MNIPRPHVVFDCNILFQAIARESGPAANRLRLAERNRVTLFVSRAVLREVRKILAYPELRERNPQLTEPVIREFIGALLFRAVLLRDVPRVITFPRDPDDEPYLDLAVAATADFLVSRDKDLLSLPTDHSILGNEFRQRFPWLRIVSPAEFLAEFSAPD